MVNVASFSLILPPPHQPHLLDSGPSTPVYTAVCPSSLSRDVGTTTNASRTQLYLPLLFQRDVGQMILARDRQGIGEGETRGGTQEVGGPSSASKIGATTSVGAHFLPSIVPSLLTLNPTNDSGNDITTMTRSPSVAPPLSRGM